MRTPKDFVSALTDPAMLTDLIALLRHKDPDFQRLEQNYLDAVSTARHTWDLVSYSTLCAYLEAYYQVLIPRMVYAGYLGFQMNLENFRSPTGRPLQRLDFSELLKEHIMSHFPANLTAEQTIQKYYHDLQNQRKDIPDAVQDYYCYLEAVAPKLAHFAGYSIANEFLCWVEPGYVPDDYQTITYATKLEQYFGYHPFPQSIF